MISEFLIAIICFLALYIGYFIAMKTKEELVIGEKYFSLLQIILFVSVVFFTFYNLGELVIGIVFMIIFLSILLFFKKDFSKWMYFTLAFLLMMNMYLSDQIVPVLVFLFGITIGSLFFFREKKGLFSNYWWFLLIVVAIIVLKTLSL